jgi:hypothetical protein
MNRLRLACVACFASLLVAGSAHAADANDDVPPKDRAPVKMEHEWYGWGTMLTDAASFAVLSKSLGPDAGPGIPIGLFMYAAGGPIVHGLEGEGGRAAASLAVRLVLPAIGAGLGAASYHRPTSPVDSPFDGPGVNAAFYGVIGGFTAMVIDAALIAHHEVPVDASSDSPRPKTTAKSKALSFIPSLSVDPRGGVRAGVGGTF